MIEPNVLDTFPAFESFWKEVEVQPVHRQIALWEGEYMARWPELLAKQIECYSSEGADWKAVARARVFPYLGDRLGRMRALHRDLLGSLPGSWARTRRALNIRFSVRFVIHVGIGCGAGWATTYGGSPACLFGLENAAENHGGGDGWSRRVVAHEVAHLAHRKWRRDREQESPDPWWKVYEEGFATYCERLVEPEEFPLRTGRKNWLRWCDAHRAWLARRFLRDANARKSLQPYFGSWSDVEGQIETGYYLGSEVIREMVDESNLRQVAALSTPEIRRQTRAALERFARKSVRPNSHG
jgi:hypothetical protein